MTAVQQVPADVIMELMLNVVLLHFSNADLCRPWCSKVFATDASSASGFGACVANCSASMAREIGRLYGDADEHVRLMRAPHDPAEKPWSGRCTRLGLRQSDFKDILSKRAKHIAHSGGLEAQALPMGMQLLARDRRVHGQRVAILVDAKVVRGAALKGKSSAATLALPIRKIAAILKSFETEKNIPKIEKHPKVKA